MNRRYRWSYILIPIPMLAGLILAAYAYGTKDTRVDCFCAVATQGQDYAMRPLQAALFQTYSNISLADCRGLDSDIDTDDGRKQGRVRWFICTGMSCGPGWEEILAE
ncbi:MAG: hypothetical protein R8K53_01710 [Mariprofundaceae bacterium]